MMTRDEYEVMAATLKSGIRMREFTEVFSQYEHPTNQQTMVRNMVGIICSLKDRHPDLRNQASVQLANQLKELQFPFI